MTLMLLQELVVAEHVRFTHKNCYFILTKLMEVRKVAEWLHENFLGGSNQCRLQRGAEFEVNCRSMSLMGHQDVTKFHK